MKRTILAAAAWISLAGLLQAGVVIEMESKDLRNHRIKGSEKTFAQGEMLAMENTDGQTTMIFRGDRMLVIDHRERSYTEIDEQTMEEIGAQLNDAMKQMKERLESLPPAQREMMERMMKGRMPAGMNMEPIDIRVEPGEKQSVGDYSCRMYSIYLNDDKSQELCAAPLSEVGAASEAWEAFQAMAHFSRKMMESFTQGPFAQMVNSNPFAMLEEIDGLPILTRSYVNGKATEEKRLLSITSQSLDDEVFLPPQDYRKKSIKDSMRGR